MFLLIEKPTWCTSFDVIRKLKKLYPRKTKIGHAGTLDPLATWLLIIAIGKDTKRIQKFVWMEKTYVATIDFSKKSDTRDSDFREYYEELSKETLKAPSKSEIEKDLESILGWNKMPLTPFSAKKIWWKKLYEYAREGNPRFIDIEMQVIKYEIIDYKFPELKIRLKVGSGTYIRSIAHWLWEKCWCGGILTQLHRESIGWFKV